MTIGRYSIGPKHRDQHDISKAARTARRKIMASAPIAKPPRRLGTSFIGTTHHVLHVKGLIQSQIHPVASAYPLKISFANLSDQYSHEAP